MRIIARSRVSKSLWQDMHLSEKDVAFTKFCLRAHIPAKARREECIYLVRNEKGLCQSPLRYHLTFCAIAFSIR